MSVNGKFIGISHADFMAVADRFAIGRAEKLIKTVTEAIAAWPEFAAQAELPVIETNMISGHHQLHSPFAKMK
jgi:hypothetical protein